MSIYFTFKKEPNTHLLEIPASEILASSLQKLIADKLKLK